MARQAGLILLLIAGMLACSRPAEQCWVCQRPIHTQVRATLALADGSSVQACCPRCALHYAKESGTRVTAIRVTDFGTGRPLPFEKAYIVEGSDETPCLHHPPVADETRFPMQICYDRCVPSLIAFATEAGARAFIANHGGTLRAPGTLRARPDTP